MSSKELRTQYLPNSWAKCIYIENDEDFKQYFQTHNSRCTYELNYPCWIVHEDESYFGESRYSPLKEEIKRLKQVINELTKDLQVLEGLS
jgi:hypothetical protein